MTKFTDLNLSPKIMQAIADVGYDTPTPIQVQAIPHAMKGRDVLGIAQTGTGKTAGFTLPMIHKLARGRARARMPRSLVLAPTRELAAQVAENFELYAKYVRLDMALLIGGVSFREQERLIDRGVDVLVATPGRLLDHFERGKLLLSGIEIMVVDEADRMLDMGFIPDIERIFKLTPFTRQTLFFSATMAPEIARITNEFLQNPAKVEVEREKMTSDLITQKVCRFPASIKRADSPTKRAVLRAMIAHAGDTLTNAIVFCNRKSEVDVLMKSFTRHGYKAGAIHGDLDQSTRLKVLDAFKNNEITFLLASDVAARGLDIPLVSHVFNYDIPTHPEDYIHRIGRTGRAGRKGASFTLCLDADTKYLEAIESLLTQKIPTIGFEDFGFEAASRGSRGGGRSRPARGESRGESRNEERGGDKPRRSSRRRGGGAKSFDSKPSNQEPRPHEARPDKPHKANNRNNKSNNKNDRGDSHKGRRREPAQNQSNQNKAPGMGDHMPRFLQTD